VGVIKSVIASRLTPSRAHCAWGAT
jgi:hypothetical protein